MKSVNKTMKKLMKNKMLMYGVLAAVIGLLVVGLVMCMRKREGFVDIEKTKECGALGCYGVDVSDPDTCYNMGCYPKNPEEIATDISETTPNISETTPNISETTSNNEGVAEVPTNMTNIPKNITEIPNMSEGGGNGNGGGMMNSINQA